MKQFMAVFISSDSDEKRKKWDALDENSKQARENEGKTAWMKWAMKNSSAIVDQGAPLGKTKRVNEQGTSDIKNKLTAYTVVRAESHEAAVKLFLDHPHFTIFPGDSVEIMECLPMPKL
ncbi:MAG TPA: hypothetical protein VE954_31240 [Oligoflexus sp.]|uniref:hypothetical protein n=1 Tax=Oligoflexus sp. TaxID=1971216 RepID=UPI002D234750|nr:hypothetical protein [Oligoflexus sp.]HYX37599.1 hypothetical protein [Oligoflexus sp.]